MKKIQKIESLLEVQTLGRFKIQRQSLGKVHESVKKKKKRSSASLKKKPRKINSCIINMLKLWYSGKLVGWCFPITWPSKLFLPSFVGSFPSLLNYPVLNCTHSISLCWFLTTCLTAQTVSGFFFSFIIFFIWKSD